MASCQTLGSPTNTSIVALEVLDLLAPTTELRMSRNDENDSSQGPVVVARYYRQESNLPSSSPVEAPQVWPTQMAPQPSPHSANTNWGRASFRVLFREEPVRACLGQKTTSWNSSWYDDNSSDYQSKHQMSDCRRVWLVASWNNICDWIWSHHVWSDFRAIKPMPIYSEL